MSAVPEGPLGGNHRLYTAAGPGRPEAVNWVTDQTVLFHRGRGARGGAPGAKVNGCPDPVLYGHVDADGVWGRPHLAAREREVAARVAAAKAEAARRHGG